VLSEVHTLLEQKRGAPELGLAPAVPLLNAFIKAELEGGAVDIPQKSRDPRVVDQLNELFHDILEEYRADISFKRAPLRGSP